jgi:hypothetical protein
MVLAILSEGVGPEALFVGCSAVELYFLFLHCPHNAPQCGVGCKSVAFPGQMVHCQITLCG